MVSSKLRLTQIVLNFQLISMCSLSTETDCLLSSIPTGGCRGPMRVVDFKKSHYTLQDLVTEKNKSFHLAQLIKPFKFDEMNVDPAAIARAEQQEFLVENIFAHRNTPGSKKRTDYEFLVKWDPEDGEEELITPGNPGSLSETTINCLCICS